MLEELGRCAREIREARGLKQLDIATAAGVTHVVVSNLERGLRYPDKLDDVVDAYERECGMRRGDLWRRAAAAIS